MNMIVRELLSDILESSLHDVEMGIDLNAYEGLDRSDEPMIRKEVCQVLNTLLDLIGWM